MKAIWKGNISFGLVTIDVAMFSAISEHKFGFRMLCGKCNTPITYFRWCEKCNKEVLWKDIVKGFPQKKKFIVLTKEMIEQIKPKTIDTITITEFVDQTEIKNLYIENNFYLAPTKARNKAFFLLAEALKQANKVAIGQFVMHEKEHLCAISAYENILLLTTLHYDFEVKNLEAFKNIKSVQITKEEISLTLQLIKKLSHKKFNLSKYQDTFVEKLKKIIMNVQKGKKIKVTPIKKRRATQSLDETLRASL